MRHRERERERKDESGRTVQDNQLKVCLENNRPELTMGFRAKPWKFDTSTRGTILSFAVFFGERRVFLEIERAKKKKERKEKEG